MPYVRDSFWRGREFTSLEQMQTAAVNWCREVAGRRQCRPLDGAAPLSCSTRSRPPRCCRCRAAPFQLARWSTRQGRPGLPHQGRQDALLGAVATDRASSVDVRATATTGADLPRRRPGQDPCRAHEQGRRTDFGDYPPEKIAFHMRTPAWCRARPREIGAALPQVIAELLEVNALLPAARRPGRSRPAQEVRRHPAGGRLRAGRSRSATRPTAPSRASSPPAPRHDGDHRDPPATRGAAAHPARARKRLVRDRDDRPDTPDADPRRPASREDEEAA